MARSRNAALMKSCFDFAVVAAAAAASVSCRNSINLCDKTALLFYPPEKDFF